MPSQNKQIVIVDYGLGNLFSLRRALTHIGFDPIISNKSSEIEKASYLILPGVGAFGDGMRNLSTLGLVQPIKEFAASGKPLLGICLGMQLLMTESEEFGLYKGLNLINGRVVRFHDPKPGGPSYKIPNVGWRGLNYPDGRRTWNQTLLSGTKEGSSVYFVHSYKVVPKERSHCLAETNYGDGKYCSVIAKDFLFGCQFHPEKSGEVGLRILKNFLNLDLTIKNEVY